MSCPVFARGEALAPVKNSVERQRCGYCLKEFTGGFAKRVVHLLGNREAGVAGSGVPNYKNQSTVPACPKFNIQDRKELVSDLERAMNFVSGNIADKKGWTKIKLVLEEGIAAAKTTGGAAAQLSPFLAATSSPVARATPPMPSPSETSARPSASRPAGIFTTTSLAAKAGLLNKKVSEQDMNQAVTEFLAESGSAPAIVALPSFQRLLDCGSQVPGYKVPPPRQFIQMQRCATHAYNLIGKNISRALWVIFEGWYRYSLLETAQEAVPIAVNRGQ